MNVRRHHIFDQCRKLAANAKTENVSGYIEQLLAENNMKFETPISRLLELWTHQYFDPTKSSSNLSPFVINQYPNIYYPDIAEVESREFKDFANFIKETCSITRVPVSPDSDITIHLFKANIYQINPDINENAYFVVKTHTSPSDMFNRNDKKFKKTNRKNFKVETSESQDMTTNSTTEDGDSNTQVTETPVSNDTAPVTVPATQATATPAVTGKPMSFKEALFSSMNVTNSNIVDASKVVETAPVETSVESSPVDTVPVDVVTANAETVTAGAKHNKHKNKSKKQVEKNTNINVVIEQNQSFENTVVNPLNNIHYTTFAGIRNVVNYIKDNDMKKTYINSCMLSSELSGSYKLINFDYIGFDIAYYLAKFVFKISDEEFANSIYNNLK